MLERQEKTKVKSSIIISSSLVSKVPWIGSLPYSASKSMASFIAEGLNYELSGKIDVFNFCPGPIATKLISMKG